MLLSQTATDLVTQALQMFLGLGNNGFERAVSKKRHPHHYERVINGFTQGVKFEPESAYRLFITISTEGSLKARLTPQLDLPIRWHVRRGKVRWYVLGLEVLSTTPEQLALTEHGQSVLAVLEKIKERA